MNLSELSIRRPVFAWMLMSALIIFGSISFLRMGVSQLPDVDFPMVSVSLTLEGAAPEVMETDVVDPIENALMTIEGVRSIDSYSRSGSASISVEFELDRKIDVAVQEIQNKLVSMVKSLPKDMDAPSVSKSNPEDQPIMWVSVRSDKYSSRDLMEYVRDHVKDQFATINGVGDLFLGGYIDPNLRVWVSTEKLSRHALTVGDVINTIKNEHAETPAGRIETGTSELNVRVLGEAQTVPQFEKMIIVNRGGAPNYRPFEIGEVARVVDELADVRRFSRSQGKAAVGIGIRKQRGSNAVDIAKLVRSKVEELGKQLPAGMEVAINFDSTKFIEEAADELNVTLVVSAILTALVCWLFLGSWSSTFNVILAIPTSVIGTFIILYFAGFTLNTFTLLALSLAIGIVVDDAIMVLENITRHLEMGKDKVQAALDGSKEITFAAISATVAIGAIFLPVVFMKGVIGKFFFQFGIALTAAVFLSLIEALTLTPMRCAQFLSVTEKRTRLGHFMDNSLKRLEVGYLALLETIMRNPKKILGSALFVFSLSIGLFHFVNKEFIPAQDQSRFMVRIQTKPGSSIEFTDEKMKQVEDFVMKQESVERYFSSVGGGGGGEVNSGMVFVTLKPKGQRKQAQKDVMQAVREGVSKIDGVKVFIQDLSMRGFSASRGFPIEFAVRGPDWEVLGETAKKLVSKMKDMGPFIDIDLDYRDGMPEVSVVPDRVKAAARGVSIAAISEVVTASIGGVVVGKFARAGHRYDIRVRLEKEERDKAPDILKLWVRNNRGELINLSEVVSVVETTGLQSINRQARERAITIFANLKQGSSQSEAIEQIKKASQDLMKDPYRIVISGSSAAFKESFQSLLFALIIGLLVSYMVLASQFNSFIDPIIVLLALPFSLTGAFLFLLLSGQSLNIYSFIGILLLMGIVKKNSILLVDFTNQVRREGVPLRDAIRKACPMRLRPILMTSVATIVGALPSALSLGAGAETRVPMGVTVIGGVLFSTVLTLFVVPAAMVLVSKEK